jgi:hypothetical protein
MNALLLDVAEHREHDRSLTPLETLHGEGISRLDRVSAAVTERNRNMEGTGQPAWSHYCDLCRWRYEDSNGDESEYRASIC